MSGFTIEVIGGDRVRALLMRVAGGMDQKVTEALDSGADRVKEDAKILCPVGTSQSTGRPGYIGGSLRKSIRKEAVARKGNLWEIGVRAGGYVTNPNTGKIVNYAKPVEFGTSRMRPRFFLRSALLSNRALIMDKILRALGEDIEEASGE